MNEVPSYKPRANGHMAPGDPQAKNVILVRWDEATQSVQLKFEPSEFKTWAFVEAVLAMAKDAAQMHGRMQQMQQMQLAAAQQAADQRLAQKIIHG